MSRALGIVLLTGVYLLALASYKPLDVLAGLLLSGCIVLGLDRFLRPEATVKGGPSLARRILAFPRFALAIIVEITIGTWRVSLIVLGIHQLENSGIVLVPFGERSPMGVAATAISITLSPGELLVDIDEERRLMLIHVLDASDPDAVRAHYDRFFDRYQRSVFP